MRRNVLFFVASFAASLFLMVANLWNPPLVFAQCTVNYTPQFFSDSRLTQPVSSLNLINSTQFDSSELFVAYQICSDTQQREPKLTLCMTAHGFTAQPRNLDLTSYCNPSDPFNIALQIDNPSLQKKGDVLYFVGNVTSTTLSDVATRYSSDQYQYSGLTKLDFNLFEPTLSFSSPVVSLNLQKNAQKQEEKCDGMAANSQLVDNQYVITLSLNSTNLIPGKNYYFQLQTGKNPLDLTQVTGPFTITPGQTTVSRGFYMPKSQLIGGTYNACVSDDSHDAAACIQNVRCSTTFSIDLTTPINPAPIFPQPGDTPPSSTTLSTYNLCGQIPTTQPDEVAACCACAGIGFDSSSGKCSNPTTQLGAQGLWTAVGCIPTNYSSIAQTVIKIGLSISGGVALLMILGAGLLLTTSQGEPKRTQDAKDLLTSAVAGLLFIIFSVTILRFIGVNILQIPGFGDTPTPILKNKGPQ